MRAHDIRKGQRYRTLEPLNIRYLLVPEADRRAPKYGGYTLVIDFDAIRTRCERIDGV